MDIESKLVTLFLLLLIAVPSLVALLYKKVRKQDFLVGYLYSVLAILLLPLVLRALGSSEFDTLIEGDKQTFNAYILSLMRITSYAVLFSIGGSSFISKTYEALTGIKLEKALEKIEEKDNERQAAITKIDQQTTSIALAVAGGVDKGIEDQKESRNRLKSLLELIEAAGNDGVGANVPHDNNLEEEANRLRALGALKAKYKVATNETRIFITDYGKKMLNDMRISAPG